MTPPSAHDEACLSNSLKLLMANQAGASQRAAPSLAGMDARQLFIDACVGKGNGSHLPSNLSKQDRTNATLVLSVYNGMLSQLMNRAGDVDTRTQARLKAIDVEKRVVEMCTKLYKATGKDEKDLPKVLQPPSMQKKPCRRPGGGR